MRVINGVTQTDIWVSAFLKALARKGMKKKRWKRVLRETDRFMDRLAADRRNVKVQRTVIANESEETLLRLDAAAVWESVKVFMELPDDPDIRPPRSSGQPCGRRKEFRRE